MGYLQSQLSVILSNFHKKMVKKLISCYLLRPDVDIQLVDFSFGISAARDLNFSQF